MRDLLKQLILEVATSAEVPAELIEANRTFAEQGLGAEVVRSAVAKLSASLKRSVPNLIWACATPSTVANQLDKEEYEADELTMQLGFRPGVPDEIYYE